MKYKTQLDKIKTCCICGIKTEQWITEIKPNEKFKDYCEECYLNKIKKDDKYESEHMIPLGQFCSHACAADGLTLIMQQIERGDMLCEKEGRKKREENNMV